APEGFTAGRGSPDTDASFGLDKAGGKMRSSPSCDAVSDSHESAPRACPNCAGIAISVEGFCLLCGSDLATGKCPPQPDLRPADQDIPRWEAVVGPDENYFRQGMADGASFPVDAPIQVFPLIGLSILIGRRGKTDDGPQLDIDLSGPPEDLGVSAMHAALE